MDIRSSLLSYITSLPRGTVVFADDLERLGFPAESVRLTLSELALEGTVLVRLARGVYCYPRMAESGYTLERLLPSPGELAGVLARRWRVRIVPCGAQAAYLAGLVPFPGGPLTFLSDGSPQYFNLQNGARIEFLRRRSAKVFAYTDENLRNLVEGFRWLGRDGVGDGELAAARELLRKVPPALFHEEVRLAPAWVRDLLRQVWPGPPAGDPGAAPGSLPEGAGEPRE